MNKRRIQLLLVEDNPGDARLMSEYLREDETLQFEVRQVDTLQAGLISLAEHTPDIILADLGLPDSQGLDTFRRLQDAAPRIPIVVLTGLNDMQQAALAVKTGAQDYLSKDEVTSSLLRRAIGYAIDRKQAGEALRQSESQYRLLAENLQDVIWVMDIQENQISYISPSITGLCGYTPDEMLGAKVTEWLTPRSAQAVASRVSDDTQLFATGKYLPGSSTFSVEQICKDGSTVWTEVTSSYVLDAQGLPIQIIGVSRDISARRQADQHIRLQAAALESAANAIVITDREGSIQWVNPAYEQLTGYSLQEAMGLNPRILKSGLQPPEFYKNLWDTILLGQVWTSELVNKRKDGSLYTEEETITPLLDESGAITHFIGIKQDITGRKQAEQDLTRSASELRALFAALPDLVLMLDKEGRYLKITETNQDLLYKPMEELIGKTLQDVFPKTEADRFMGFILDVLKTNNMIRFEYSLLINEKEIWFAATVTPVTEDSVIWVARDVTENKQAERSLQESHSLLQATLESTAEGILVVDLQGCIRMTNAKFSELWGIPPAVLGTQDDAVVLKYVLDKLKDPQLFIKKVEELYATPDAESFDVLEFKDGTIFERVSRPQFQVGTIVGRVWSFRDVTERKKAEDLLLKSEGKYRSLFENVPDGVYRTTPDGKILAVNRALVTMMGFESEEEFRNTSAYKVYESETSRDQFLAEINKNGFVKNMEVHLRTLQGKPLVGLENARAYRDETGKVLYYEGTLTDITERKQVETERQTLLEIMHGLTVTADLNEYLEVVHRSIAKVIYAKNFFIALFNEETGLFETPYFVDEVDLPVTSYEMGKSLSAYVYRNGAAYLFDEDSFNDLLAQGVVELIGSYSPSWLGVPLMVSRETMGVMVVQDYENKNRYTQHDLEFLSSISAQVTQAISRKAAETELAVLFEVEKRRSQRMSDLQILSAELNSLHTEQELLERLVNKAALLSSSPVCTVMLLDEKTDEIILSAQFGLPASISNGLRLPIALMPPEAVRAFQSGKSIIISDIDQELPAIRNVLVHTDVHAFFAFPLVLDGIVAGVITLSSLQPRKPSEAEIKTYELLARLASAALDNVRLFEGINRSLQRMGALRRVDMAISASFDLVMTLNILLEQVTTQLGVDAADILIYDPNDSTLKYSCGRGFRSQALRYTNLRVGEGFAGQAALERRTIHVSDLNQDMSHLSSSLSLPSEGFVTYWGVPLLSKGDIHGVLEVFSRKPVPVDQDWLNFMQTLAGQAAIAVDNVLLFNHLERSNADLSLAYDSTLTGWASALELRDNETEGHTRRVAATTTQLAVRMGVRDQEIMYMRWGSLLHDIGKMGIPDSILLKPGPLSDEEWVVMRTHPGLAYEMLAPIEYLGNALDIPYNHHEKWDGSGYPRGLKGDQIPLAARIFAIVDVWDALTSDRPYRKAWSPEKTMLYIQEQVNTHFDPQVVQAFLEMVGPDGKLPGE